MRALKAPGLGIANILHIRQIGSFSKPPLSAPSLIKVSRLGTQGLGHTQGFGQGIDKM